MLPVGPRRSFCFYGSPLGKDITPNQEMPLQCHSNTVEPSIPFRVSELIWYNDYVFGSRHQASPLSTERWRKGALCNGWAGEKASDPHGRPLLRYKEGPSLRSAA